MNIIRNIVFILAITSSISVLAKRLPPAEVESVVYAGVRYSVPHWGFENDAKQNGGYVLATKIKTDKILWRKRIYKIFYKPAMEKDGQDVFITALEVLQDEKSLLITNEKNSQYKLNLETLKVEKLSKNI
ncbi:MAG: hypothetical protein KDK04_15680 [Candidatus Competibacteraceae bacterium]|nr:hypothetical protein [Candidatus Competibacteraceae bacterium]